MGGFEFEKSHDWVRLGSFRPEIRPLRAAVNQHSLTHNWRKEPQTKVGLSADPADRAFTFSQVFNFEPQCARTLLALFQTAGTPARASA
jgi:hypothetical protein